jgi:hypothetical protein
MASSFEWLHHSCVVDLTKHCARAKGNARGGASPPGEMSDVSLPFQPPADWTCLFGCFVTGIQTLDYGFPEHKGRPMSVLEIVGRMSPTSARQMTFWACCSALVPDLCDRERGRRRFCPCPSDARHDRLHMRYHWWYCSVYRVTPEKPYDRSRLVIVFLFN